jgi:hypothetical protein
MWASSHVTEPTDERLECDTPTIMRQLYWDLAAKSPLLMKISVCHKLSGEVTKQKFYQVCHSHLGVTNHSKLYSTVETHSHTDRMFPLYVDRPNMYGAQPCIYCLFHVTLPNRFCTFILHHSFKLLYLLQFLTDLPEI